MMKRDLLVGLAALSLSCASADFDVQGGAGGSGGGGTQGDERPSQSAGGSGGTAAAPRPTQSSQPGAAPDAGRDSGSPAAADARPSADSAPTMTTPPPPAAMGTPVARWGQLKICGVTTCDQAGNKVQLKGLSTHWLNWEGMYSQSRAGLRWFRDNWNLSVVRAAMGVEPPEAYLEQPDRMIKLLETVIQNAVAEGLYVIIDWHDHQAHMHQKEAAAFFTQMAAKWGNLPNVIYEDYNEPRLTATNGAVPWGTVLKPYHQAIIAAIRAKDPDNIIVLGTSEWSQRVDQAAADPVMGTNLAYSLHFYTCNHGATNRAYAQTAVSKGLPLFITEWAATNFTGGKDGSVCADLSKPWMDFAAANKIGWTAWQLNACADLSCVLKPDAPIDGGWTDAQLNGQATYVRGEMKKP